MYREYTLNDFDEVLRLRCLLYPHYSKQELSKHLTAFLHQPHVNPFQNYDLFAIFVYQRDSGELGGFIAIGLVNANEYKDRLVHFVGTDYYEQIRQTLSKGHPIPAVESWYVDEDLRGNGIGTQLMLQAEQWVKDNGYSFILSDTDSFRDISKKAHESFGYEIYHIDNEGTYYFYKRIV